MRPKFQSKTSYMTERGLITLKHKLNWPHDGCFKTLSNVVHIWYWIFLNLPRNENNITWRNKTNLILNRTGLVILQRWLKTTLGSSICWEKYLWEAKTFNYQRLYYKHPTFWDFISIVFLATSEQQVLMNPLVLFPVDSWILTDNILSFNCP